MGLRWYLDRLQNVEPPYPERCDRVRDVRDAMQSIGRAWPKLKVRIPQVEEIIERLECACHDIESTVDLLAKEIVTLDKLKEAARLSYEGLL